jgi:hypothetical protein
LSFFDEADETEPNPRPETRRPRSMSRPRQQRSGRPPGGSGRPPGSQHPQDVQTRRLVAVGVVVVIVILLAVLVKSCSSSATTTSLKNYNASVYNLISASDANGVAVFRNLSDGPLSSTNLLTSQVQQADKQLSQAEQLSVPSQMAAAQSYLVSVMKLRAQGIEDMAANAAQAASSKTSKDAVYNISVGTSKLFGSDVVYKTSVVTNIAKALNADGIHVGTSAGQPNQINPGQIVTDLGWLQSSWIADKIGAQQSTAQANKNNDQPGLHGHSLNFVTVDGTQLSSTSTNTIPANNARTWVLNVTNGGDFNEFDVGCSVTIAGLSDTGTSSIPETVKQQSANCTVTLPSDPTPGTYSVTARVAKVPGETNLTNNVITYSVIFN